MTDFVRNAEEMIVGVHIVGDDTKVERKRRIVSTYNSYSINNTSLPTQLLRRAPNRIRTLLQVYTNGITIADNGSDAAAGSAAGNGLAGNVCFLPGNNANIWYLTTTEELWAVGTVAGNANIQVIQEFEVFD